MAVPGSGARWAVYSEHIQLDTGVTIAGSSRLADGYPENILGHRSGTCVVSGTASISGGTAGAQSQATAFTQQNAMSWPEEAQLRRYNPDSQ